MNILDVIFPRWCIGCGRKLVSGERYLCLHCLADLPRTDLWLHPEDNKLAKAFYDIPCVNRVAAFVRYSKNGFASDVVKTFKYRDQKNLAQYCGRLMANEMSSSGIFNDIDAIIPVPLTLRRKMSRGYNQSEYIARGISEVTKIPVCTNLLKRQRFDESQTSKSPWERLENVEGVFYIDSKNTDTFRGFGKFTKRGMHILLVDDVITVGATTKACCKALLQIPDITVSIVSFATAHKV